MVLSPPKGGKSCFISKFRRMAPRPPTADLVHVKFTAFSAFASTVVTVTKQHAMVSVLRALAQQSVDEMTSSLCINRFHCALEESLNKLSKTGLTLKELDTIKR